MNQCVRLSFIFRLLMLLSIVPQLHASSSFEKAWQGWVEERHKDIACPWQLTDESKRLCEWPGQLIFEQQRNGLTFSYQLQTFADESFIQLPGDEKHWPEKLRHNYRSAAVVERNGKPYLKVAKGEHTIKGRFNWQRQPASLTLPAKVVLVSMLKQGKLQQINRRGNQLIFKQQQSSIAEKQQQSLNVEVYRLLNDGLPLMLDTQVKLSVSGKAREVQLGRLLPEGSEVVQLKAGLPARIEADGKLRVQVKAGEHTIHLRSRFINNITQLHMQRQGEYWPEYEYLSFNSNTDIRQVKLSGATSIDTSQVPIPAGWRNYPTYRLSSDTALQITTEERGDRAPVANQLSVTRDLWLDFDGKALTALDNVQGQMYQQWRLNAADAEIGRATVAGQPVLITSNKGQQGIEIRSQHIDLQAVTRIDNPAAFSAVGWQARSDNLDMTLHLPPGWRVLHASGVDNIYGTWIKKWDLWDIFLLLILIAAIHKLFGFKSALLATVTLLLTYHETGAPVGLWAVLVFVVALLPILKGKLQQIISAIGGITVAILLMVIISFAVSAFRLTMYPTLERGSVGHYQGFSSSRYQQDSVSLSDMAMEEEVALAGAMRSESKVMQKAKRVKGEMVQQAPVNLYTVDENDRIQTGPGLPTWTWSSVRLRSTGPVADQQQIQVIYSPPWMTRCWRILSVVLITALAVVFGQRLGQLMKLSWPGKAPVQGASEVLLLVAIATTLPVEQVHAENYPPKYLLDELEQRLLQAPDCLPGCVALNQGRVMVDEQRVRLHFDVYADADVALPIPATDFWQRIRVDGDAGLVRKQRGQTLLLISKGLHQVRLEGKVHAEQFSLSFPLPIHNFAVETEHWIVDGLVDGRIPNKTLNFSAKAKVQQSEEDTLIPEPVKPFVLVHRELILEKQWRLYTRIERLAPMQGAITVNIPLLAGEQVLSDLHIKDEMATVQLKANHRSFSWQSTLEPVTQLLLTAAQSPTFLETWRVKPSSLWRLQYQGIPPVKEAGQASTLQPLWKPWPDETLTLSIDRPQGIQGPVQTVETAKLIYTAGKQLQKSELQLQIRSSQGESYEVGLPENAEILAVNLDGKRLNTPTANRVRVELQPGLQTLNIAFQQQQGLSWLSRTPEIQLPGNATNIRLEYHLPRDRWPLFLSGPAIGPAMLYWGVLFVIVIAAVLLAQLAKRIKLQLPVKMHDWLLLGIGLSTVNSYGVILIALFFYALALRQQKLPLASLSRGGFNLLQLLLVLLTLAALVTLLAAIPSGLLSSPNMKVVGNGSYSAFYSYYQDRAAAGAFPTAEIYSVSLMSYRLVMLAWSLWLATRLIGWAVWWWQAFSAQEVWRAGVKKKHEVSEDDSAK